jgi:hypothetical protein
VQLNDASNLLTSKQKLMKQFLLIITMFACAHLAKSQFTKGQKFVGGNLSLQFNQNKNEFSNPANNTNFFSSVSGSVGKFTSSTAYNSFSTIIGYGFNSTDNLTIPINTDTKNTFIGLGFSKTKLFPLYKKIMFTTSIGGTIGYEFGKTTRTNSPTINNYGYNAGIGFTPGLIYRYNKKILLTTGFTNLLSANFIYRNIDKNQLTSFTLSAGTSQTFISGLQVGFSVLL